MKVGIARDKGMLRRKEVDRGYFVRNTESEAQLREVVRALQLEALVAPFTRCRACNVPLEAVPKEAVIDRLPEKVRGFYQRFRRCPGCGRVYWEGTHFERMRGVIERLGAEYSPGRARKDPPSG